MESSAYMSDPASKSIRGFIEALEIFSKYAPGGTYQKFFCEAEHDVIYVHVDGKQVPESSEDGLRLYALGFHLSSESGTWAYFT